MKCSRLKCRAFCRVLRPVFLLFLCLAAACRLLPKDTPVRRYAAAIEDREKLRAETEAELAESGPELTLDECLAIARRRSRILVARRIEARIGRLDRDIAFSTFLPTVNAGLGATGQSKPPIVQAGLTQFQATDQRLRDFSAMVYQPVFAPSLWLLYSAATRGEKIHRLVLRRATQMVEAQVTALFYQAALLDETVRYQQTRLDQVRRHLVEIRALAAAGYALKVDVQRLDALESARVHDLTQARRDADNAKLRLLDALNLWPLTPVKLAAPPLFSVESADGVADPVRTDAATTAGPVNNEAVPDALRDPTAWKRVAADDWMFEALLRRPEMHIEGLRADISRVQVLQALSVFLPHVYAFAGRYATTDSHLVYPGFWVSGIKGVLSLFSGFRDVHTVMRAREQARASRVSRENTAMMILVQVVEARRSLEQSWELCRVAKRGEAAAGATFRQVQARRRAGLVPLSAELQSSEAYAGAHLRARAAAFRYAVALSVFHNAVGQGGDPLEPKPRGLAILDKDRAGAENAPDKDREEATP